jgi:predicted TIM-barrel fold metal-dependent hydrolase
MTIDTHVHLASADLERYPHAAERPFETAAYVNRAEHLLARMDEAGVAGATIVQAFGLYGFDNSLHADAAAQYPERFVGVCGLSPALPDAPARLRELVQARGMRGLRVVLRGGPLEASPDDARFRALMTEAEHLGIPVCLLTLAQYLPAIGDLARRQPGLRIAIDHLGIPNRGPVRAEDRLLALAEMPNVFLKFSSMLFLGGPDYLDLLHRLIARFGADRLLWGSNYPPTDEGGYVNTVEIARRALADLPASDQHALFTGTALRLWPQLSGATTGRGGMPGG